MPQRALLYFASSSDDSLAQEENRLVEEVNTFLGMLDRSFKNDKTNCSCNCASAVECTVFVFLQENGDPVVPCKCSEERCQEPAENKGANAEVMISETRGQLTLREIGEKTYEDPILYQLREEVLQGRTGDVERSLIRMRSPRIGIRQSELGPGSMHARNIKPIRMRP